MMDCNGVLKVCGRTAVTCHDSPMVRQHKQFMTSYGYHGFNRYAKTVFQLLAGALFTIVGNLRVFVHFMTDAMTDTYFTAWQLTAPDAAAALVSVVVVDPKPNPWSIHLRCRGLAPDGLYKNSLTGHVATGSALMAAGLTLPMQTGDYPATQIWLERVD